MKIISINIARQTPLQDVANWVITAFEGGSNYWIETAKTVYRDEGQHGTLWRDMLRRERDQFVKDGVGPYADPEFWASPDRGYLIDFDQGQECEVLNVTKIAEGVQKMSDAGLFERVARLLDGEYDAEDADVLVQYALLGELVYG